MTSVVLDASALLAFLFGESGGDQVEQLLEGSVMSAVNWAEVVQRGAARRLDTSTWRDRMGGFGLTVVPFTPEDAESTAQLWSVGRDIGLSLADRACLALADRLDLAAYTADRAWTRVQLSADVRLIR